MAMNKKEKALLEQAQYEARLNRALRFTDREREPDMPVPSLGDGVETGYTYNRYTEKVTPTWSTVSMHGTPSTLNKPDLSSQGGVRQYSTRLKALQALRREMEDEFAKRLAAIDAQIEEEKAQ